MDSIKVQLLDMGFHESKVARAIESCPEAKTLEQVMEWLIAHEDELNDQGTSNPAANDQSKVRSQQPENDSEKASEDEAIAAAKKKLTVEEAQRLIAERQAIRAEEERQKAIEDEKRRRVDGQKMAMTRQELQDQERIHLAQQIRREKLEKEAHKKRVLDQIARDRELMKNRSKLLETSSDETNTKVTPSSNTVNKPKPSASSTECKLALRFPDGSNLIHKFSPQEQLAAVRLFVQMQKSAQSSSIEFVAPPNRKLSDSVMNETLESLGLCPASRLEVKYSIPAWVDLD